MNAPDGPTKVKILTAIAEEHNVKWEPNWIKEDPVQTFDIPVLLVLSFSVDGTSISHSVRLVVFWMSNYARVNSYLLSFHDQF